MMTRLMVLSAVLVALAPGSVALGQGPCVNPELRSSAVRLVPEWKRNFPLEATPLLHLTEDVIDLKKGWVGPAPFGVEVPVVCFFRVEFATYLVEGKKVVGQGVEVDGKTEWIATFYDQREFLFASNDWTGQVKQFNELAKALDFHIANSGAALNVFYLFLQVAGAGQLQPHLVSDEMQLESVALLDYRYRVAAKESRKAFDKWWRSVSPAVRKAISAPKVISEGDGFRVRYVLYSNGSILLQNLLVSKDGTVTEGQPEKIVSDM